MIDLEEAAASIYGDRPMAASTPAPAPQPNQDAQTAARLWGEGAKNDTSVGQAEPDGPTPEEVEADKQAEQTRLVQVNYGPQLRDLVSASTERLGLTAEEAQASAVEWGGIFREHDLNPKDVSALVEAGVAAHARGVSDEQSTQWRVAALDGLKREYGPSGAAQAVKDANALLARDPRLAGYLERRSLLNHPDVVRVIAARAHQLRSEGKL